MPVDRYRLPALPARATTSADQAQVALRGEGVVAVVMASPPQGHVTRITTTVALSVAPSMLVRFTSRRAAISAEVASDWSICWRSLAETWFDSPSEQTTTQSPGVSTPW